MISPLNWKELARLAALLRPEIENTFVDAVAVPQRTFFPEGYLKGEFMLRLTARGREAALLFSLRNREPYLCLMKGKGPKIATEANQPPFIQIISKTFKGARVTGIEALHKERILIIWFGDKGLVLSLIPAVPEAFLVEKEADKRLRIITASRKHDVAEEAFFAPPQGANAPETPAVREELLTDAWSFSRTVHEELLKDAFKQRTDKACRVIWDLIKQSTKRKKQAEEAKREAEKEPDWQRYADLLKASMHENPPIESGADGRSVRHVIDYSNGERVAVPAEPKLSLKEQVEKFYQKSRRKNRRFEEAKARSDELSKDLERLDQLLTKKPSIGDWEALEHLERSAGIVHGEKPGASGATAGGIADGAGKIFISRDGLRIRAGRNRIENMDVTFKCARGNDIWMHVKGKPGAHVVVHLPSNKSAPLETLLDAATLALHYSGGANWGKTEIDYTFKKYVKRIKDSTEASYTNNKTLIVELDEVRLKRLLG